MPSSPKAGHESDAGKRGSDKRKDAKSDRKTLKAFGKNASSSLKASSPSPKLPSPSSPIHESLVSAQEAHQNVNQVDVVRAIMERNDGDCEATDEDPDLTSKL